ncbi:hypothetical protein [Microbispora sp. KK1-11]|uniref:hypothetical protein n=1 Tax=Microbispora sp. KK1-11 TaxID=2053005 RepID=UPI00115A9455|nr:hypothetical protein [Microbispora sp. KK1-11]TQS18634.1 hypothetical protein FLW16_42480 [Microbispora sp. KK1-11]
MTYDVHLVRRLPGRTLLETLEAINAHYDPDRDEPLVARLTAEHRAAWDRIVRRATEEIGPVDIEEFPSGLTLRTQGSHAFQLNYDGDSADISIPYHYAAEEAGAVLAKAYRLARLVEEEAGLEGYDPQSDRPTAENDLASAITEFTGIVRWIAETLH